ncbi:Do family serine endopeptidase [Parvularcula dongshanensis]|uniref:Serine protease Do n=1 Tax=Parvularcula dongshanensis TaxID=1173995 RepID=A0A840I145_9PROT|nr:Do family serine endopeptidase [Parvularcula dongshanensis]MBB4658549.1 serine protease Do [Parvularcula dongshanensis]
MNTSARRETLLASAGAFALGALSVGSVQFASAQNDAPREAKPQLMRPDPGFIQQLSFADLVEDVSPAVVSIRTTQTLEESTMAGLPPEFERMLPPQFRDQFRDRFSGNGPAEPRQAMGEGSGFFIDANGHIVTNNHVVDGADEIVAVLHDGTELQATLVGTDPATDIAVLKVEPSSNQRYVQFSPNADLRVGDYVLAVGNPFGLGGTVTSGIVSAIGGDELRDGVYNDFIQIDASINRGNSGGPTFDLRGNVVGVNTAIISPTGANVGIGLAVPADTASEVTRQIIEEGGVTRGWLGVGITDLDDRLASAVGLDEARGALVGTVQDDSPAAKAGLEDGDVILRFGDTDIDSATMLTRTVGRASPGQRVPVRVLRDGKERTVNVELERRDDDRIASATTPGGQPEGDDRLADSLGVTLAPLNDAVRSRYQLDEDVTGVLVTKVDPSSEASEAGIREGMVITEADNREVESLSDLEDVVKMARDRGKEAVLVRVLTARGLDFRALPVTSDS